MLSDIFTKEKLQTIRVFDVVTGAVTAKPGDRNTYHVVDRKNAFSNTFDEFIMLQEFLPEYESVETGNLRWDKVYGAFCSDTSGMCKLEGIFAEFVPSFKNQFYK